MGLKMNRENKYKSCGNFFFGNHTHLKHNRANASVNEASFTIYLILLKVINSYLCNRILLCLQKKHYEYAFIFLFINNVISKYITTKNNGHNKAYPKSVTSFK